MASKLKSSCHSKSKTPSPSPSTSHSHLKSSISKPDVENNNTEKITENPDKPDHSYLDPLELQNLIHKLRGISISKKYSELSQGSFTSHLTPSQRITRAQRKRLGIPPIEFPLSSHKKARKTPAESHSEVLSSFSSTIPSTSSQVHSSIFELQIMVHTGTGSTSSSTQSPSTTATHPPTHTPMMAGNPPPRPWSNLGAVKMPVLLSQLPVLPKKWFHKFNPDNVELTEEHINNFMLSINLNGVIEKDIVVRLFPYTLQGVARSWYFSLPTGSNNNQDTFQD